MGRERGRVLGVRSIDPVVSFIGSLGLAAAAGSALVVDFEDQVGSGGRSLADLVGEGPRLEELSPGRPGVAVMRSGGIGVDEASALIERLSRHWPALVVRAPGSETPWAVVPVVPLYPGWLAPVDPLPAVWQAAGPMARAPGPGPVLPMLRPSEVRRLLEGGLPSKGRWLSIWEKVWGMPWA